MDSLANFNICKSMFFFLSSIDILCGLLICICGSYLPKFLTSLAVYGKLGIQDKTSFANKLKVPKSYFRHFYSTSAFITCPIVLYEVITVYILHGEVSPWFKSLINILCGRETTATVSATHALIAIVLLVLQVFRRFYDTHFVSVFSEKAATNLLMYSVGILYYPSAFLLILSEAPIFAKNSVPNFINGSVNWSDFSIFEVFVITVFLWAWYHQHITSVILSKIRKNEKGNIVNNSYKIPEGDWFKYLSSPHFNAEILMYSVLTLLLWNNSAWWYVYALVLSNQIRTMVLSHQWYKKQFKNFPKDRKALIPFIY